MSYFDIYFKHCAVPGQKCGNRWLSVSTSADEGDETQLSVEIVHILKTSKTLPCILFVANWNERLYFFNTFVVVFVNTVTIQYFPFKVWTLTIFYYDYYKQGKLNNWPCTNAFVPSSWKRSKFFIYSFTTIFFCFSFINFMDWHCFAKLFLFLVPNLKQWNLQFASLFFNWIYRLKFFKVKLLQRQAYF